MLFRELRLALTAPLLWALTLLCALVAFASASAHVAASFAVSVALPFVVAHIACDHATTRALLQLGRSPLALTIARFIASCIVIDVLVAPAVLAAYLRAPDDVGSVLAFAVGAGCTGIAMVGITLVASSLAPSRAAATLGALVVTCGAWALDAARAPFSFAMPTAALRVFTYGLVDGKDVVTLVGGGLGLLIAAAVLLPRTAAVEARALRAVGALVVTAVVCGGASQVRVSADLTRAQRVSFPAPWVHALSQVGDRIEVTLHARRDDPRIDTIDQRVLVPLRRYAKVRTRFAEPDGAGGLVTWRVAGQEAQSDDVTALDAERAVRTILDLAGVPLAR